MLAAAGAIFAVAAAGLVWAGINIPGLIRAQIPPEAPIDEAQVGGALVALGALAGLVGAAHLLMIPVLVRAHPTAVVGGIAGSATLATLAAASSIGALVALASGSASAATMLPAAGGLALVALAYAWLAALLVGLRNRTRSAGPPD